jgi:peroxiredoxin
MKTQARIWLVVVALFVAIGAVYALSTSTPPSSSESQPVAEATQMSTPAAQSTEPAPTQAPNQATDQAKLAAGPANAPVSLSPDLSHTDAYEFIDPVPVGHQAPDFTATTADGKPIKLSQYKGKKNLVLVFYQGSFCSVCGAQLTNLQNHMSAFKQQDAEIIAISADDKVHALQSVGEHGLTFPVVPDDAKKIIQKFGIANVSKKGIAWPSAFVIDKKGVVQMSYASQEGHRLHSNEILPVLAKITGRPAPKGLDYNN